MFSDLRINQLGPDRLELSERAALVGSNQARVACHVGGEDRGQTARLAHVCSPTASRKPERKISRCSGFRNWVPEGTTTGVRDRSRLTIVRASSSRPICA